MNLPKEGVTSLNRLRLSEESGWRPYKLNDIDNLILHLRIRGCTYKYIQEQTGENFTHCSGVIMRVVKREKALIKKSAQNARRWSVLELWSDYK